MKITLIAEPDDRAVLVAWLDENRSALEYVSANEGCGCCVDIYHITGPAPLLSSVPEELSGGSNWDTSPEYIRTFEEHQAAERKVQIAKAEQKERHQKLKEAHEAFRQKRYRKFIHLLNRIPVDKLGPLELKRLSIAKRQMSSE